METTVRPYLDGWLGLEHVQTYSWVIIPYTTQYSDLHSVYITLGISND